MTAMQPLGIHLHERLKAEPDRVVATYVALDGSARDVAAATLAAHANAVARALRQLGLGPRALVAIVHRSGPWLHAAWIGALWAGHVPTMIAPPSPRMEARKYAEGFCGMVGALGIDAVVLDQATRAALGALMPAGTPAIVTDSLQPDDGAPEVATMAGLDDEVAVQHTSGTTGLQKAVGFTSRQVHVHAAALLGRLQATPADVVVSWLPLYHDMGFIACFVTPLISGMRIVEMSPFDWVQRPALLLDAIDSAGGTLCWLPNFAFKVLSEERLLTVAAEQGRSWRLGGVRAFVSCSEPVMAEAIGRFVERLAPFGVRRHQVLASYAMAEAIFGVTQNAIGAPVVAHLSRAALEREGRAVPHERNDTKEPHPEERPGPRLDSGEVTFALWSTTEWVPRRRVSSGIECSPSFETAARRPPQDEDFVGPSTSHNAYGAVAGMSGAEDVIELVSCGTALPTIAIEVRDAGGRVLGDGAIGQIHIAGPHVFAGYRRQPERDAPERDVPVVDVPVVDVPVVDAPVVDAPVVDVPVVDVPAVDAPVVDAPVVDVPVVDAPVVDAAVVDTSVIDDRGFYATGDLGFLIDGELYVTGRLKDLIIIRGRNYYPQDIEALVGAVAGVVPGRVAAFGIPDAASGTEQLVILMEIADGEAPGKVALAVRRAIAQSLDTTAGDVRVVPPRALVKSTAGKVSRAENRRRYLEAASRETGGHETGNPERGNLGTRGAG